MYLYRDLMTDILENKTDLWETDLGSQQVVMVVFEFLISKVIPPARRDRNINLTQNKTRTCWHRHTEAPAI